MKKEKILVIDDELIITSCILEMLNKLGYKHVECADNGEKATELLKKNKYDVVLMDINLGHGTDGIDIVKEMQKEKNVPVIYLTGNSDSKTMNKAKSTRPVAYITKPISETNLKVQLEVFIRNRKKTQV